ncbi:MAG: site-specific integrase, partial [Hyphomicrobiaceae bacterium]|nr:site-specific integrase [Hyphomicrobiaceae bacterium]
MSDTIRVHVVDYGRKFLMMRYTCPLTGKQIARSTRTTSKKEAAKAAGAWEAELRQGRASRSPRMKWADFRVMFMDEATGDMRGATVAGYVTMFNLFERHCRPAVVGDLTTERVAGFRRELEKELVTRNGEKTTRSPATIASLLRYVRSVANWAVKHDLLAKVPRIDMPRKRDGAHQAKARAVTGEEFDRMCAAAAKVVGEDAAESWKLLMRGMYLGGLRLTEALALRWDHQPGGCSVRLDGERSVLLFDGQSQKNGKVQAAPMAPELVKLLKPHQRQAGRVFRPLLGKDRATSSAITVGRVIGDIGKRAGVVVNPASGKFASAHDLRRAFGHRWSRRVMPAVLKELMRHSAVSTTLEFYAGGQAELTSASLWQMAEVKAG